MITIENLKVQFKDKVALNIDKKLEIKDGERVGIIGANGAGKTTLINSILGLVDYSGNIRSNLRPEEMAVHMQYNEYNDMMPIRYVMEAILGQKLEENSLAMEMIEFFDFKDSLKKKFKHLSGGQKQRMTLILVLSQDSDIVMLDEVTSGLDFVTRQRLMDKLVEWYKDKKTTLLITSHYYSELDNLADKIIFLDDGKLIEYGQKDELFRKYCGNSVIVFENNEEISKKLENFSLKKAPQDTIAVSCNNEIEEIEIAKLLSQHNQNYRRSNNDIEIMTLNALEQYEMEH
ncbi:ABC transporter ATP-binding protein [Helcococcus kunzii]|uniref:ATP-binding cassette domain-containing protein n=1 Tax=Helcococcus kunzii TaxID=40091 RepID=UPI001BAF509C|nr:ABC transporter ATP-binding protein [Helcococcus kunzii]QUY64234.1 ABC transporter ATP-binding protein [Helcococcus kunzii]QZO76690.1 ABC transporter ATP-binding protein [Helcococcus kunzii]